MTQRKGRLGRPFSYLRALSVCAAAQTGRLAIDYPLTGSVFPPEFPPPTFLWRDTVPGVNVWIVEAAGQSRAHSRPPDAPGPHRPALRVAHQQAARGARRTLLEARCGGLGRHQEKQPGA